MPIYEYRCDNCGHNLEVIQKMSDSPLAECPACGEARLRKLISAVAFRLKGGGWYETDFKSGDKKKNIDTPDTSPAQTSADKAEEKPMKKSADKAGITPPKKGGGTEAVAG